ncbi:MAG: hypothetical protein HY722_00270 [Planctomycetes bacterium]|nr:hypothetical protein [Planctomycetota bacterium]
MKFLGYGALLVVVVFFGAGPVLACGGMPTLAPEPAPPEGFDGVPDHWSGMNTDYDVADDNAGDGFGDVLVCDDTTCDGSCDKCQNSEGNDRQTSVGYDHAGTAASDANASMFDAAYDAVIL